MSIRRLVLLGALLLGTSLFFVGSGAAQLPIITTTPTLPSLPLTSSSSPTTSTTSSSGLPTTVPSLSTTSSTTPISSTGPAATSGTTSGALATKTAAAKPPSSLAAPPGGGETPGSSDGATDPAGLAKTLKPSTEAKGKSPGFDVAIGLLALAGCVLVMARRLG